MVTILGVMVYQGEIESYCNIVALVKPSWYDADMLETFLLEIFNEKSQNALMVCTNVKEILFSIIRDNLVCLKLVLNLICEWIKPHQAYVVYIFAAKQLICLRLKVVFSTFWGNLKLKTIWENWLFLKSV